MRFIRRPQQQVTLREDGSKILRYGPHHYNSLPKKMPTGSYDWFASFIEDQWVTAPDLLRLMSGPEPEIDSFTILPGIYTIWICGNQSYSRFLGGAKGD